VYIINIYWEKPPINVLSSKLTVQPKNDNTTNRVASQEKPVIGFDSGYRVYDLYAKALYEKVELDININRDLYLFIFY